MRPMLAIAVGVALAGCGRSKTAPPPVASDSTGTEKPVAEASNESPTEDGTAPEPAAEPAPELEGLGLTGPEPNDRRDAPPYELTVPPTPRDCWKPSDVKRMRWKDGNQINAFPSRLLECNERLREAIWDDDLAALKRAFRGKSATLVDCEAGDGGMSLLQAAATNDKPQIVELLLEKGADVGACDMMGRTALHSAVGAGQLATAKLLLSKGAYADAVTIHATKPIHKVWLGSDDNKAAGAMLRLLLSHGAAVDSADRDAWTPLHYAAAAGDLDSVKLLIEKGAKPDAKNAKGQLPADVAEEQEVIDYLKEAR